MEEEEANMTLPTYGNNRTVDYFAHVFSDRPSQVLAAACWCCVEFIGIPLFVGAISYERGGTFHFQTLINKLSSYTYALLALYCMVGFNIYFFRYFSGPLPGFICKIQALQKRGVGFAINLSLAEAMILRYLYSCVWKNIGVLNEEFFGASFVVVNSVLSTFHISIIYFIGNFYDFHYALCMGQNLDTILRGATVVVSYPDLTRTLAFFNSTLSMAMCYLTHWRSKKAQQSNQTGQSVQQNQYTVKNLFEVSKLFDFVILILIVLGLLPYLLMQLVCGDSDIHLVPPLLTTASVFLPHADLFFLIPLALYMKRPHLRAHAIKVVGEVASRLARFLPAHEPAAGADAEAEAPPAVALPVEAVAPGQEEGSSKSSPSSPRPRPRPPRPASAPPGLIRRTPVPRSPTPSPLVVQDI